VVLTFKPADEMLKCDHSNESYQAVLSCGAVYYAVQGGSNFESVEGTLKCDHSNKKATEQYFLVVLFIMLYKVALTTEQYFPVLSFVCFDFGL